MTSGRPSSIDDEEDRNIRAVSTVKNEAAGYAINHFATRGGQARFVDRISSFQAVIVLTRNIRFTGYVVYRPLTSHSDGLS